MPQIGQDVPRVPGRTAWRGPEAGWKPALRPRSHPLPYSPAEEEPTETEGGEGGEGRAGFGDEVGDDEGGLEFVELRAERLLWRPPSPACATPRRPVHSRRPTDPHRLVIAPAVAVGQEETFLIASGPITR